MSKDYDSLSAEDLTTALSAAAFRLRSLLGEEDAKEVKAEHLELVPEPAQTVVSTSDPSIDAMRELIANIEQGRDIQASFDKIKRLIHNQESRAEVFNSLSLTHDYGRYASFLGARRKIELEMLQSIDSGNLSPAEKFMVIEYLNNGIGKIEGRLASSTAGNKDVMSLLAKVDYVVSNAQLATEKKMASTTPQNREILRRVGHKLLKMVPKRAS